MHIQIESMFFFTQRITSRGAIRKGILLRLYFYAKYKRKFFFTSLKTIMTVRIRKNDFAALDGHGGVGYTCASMFKMCSTWCVRSISLHRGAVRAACLA